MMAHTTPWPARLARSIPVPEANVAEHLQHSARSYPSKAAVEYYGSTLNYATLQQRVLAVADFLRDSCRVARGDRVLIDLQSSPGFMVFYYAILRAGAVAVPINPMSLENEIRWFLADSDAEVACIGQEFVARFSPLLEDGTLRHVLAYAYADDLGDEARQDLRLPVELREPLHLPDVAGMHAMAEILAGADAERLVSSPPPLAKGQDTAVIVYTSGTTGKPKGCMLSHSALNAQIILHYHWEAWSAASIGLAVAPFFHVTGMSAAMNLPVYAGGSLCLLSRWDKALAAELIERKRITHWTNIPTMVVDLLSLPGVEESDFSSLLFIGGGGAAMPSDVAQRLEQQFGLRYQEGWGMTELGGGVFINPPEAARYQCLGVPTIDVEARVVDIVTQEPLPDGEQGEIVVNARTLFSGYWKCEQATRDAFAVIDGQSYFRSGDIGYRDANGYFYMTDRLKRMVNAAGFKVWPAEVENLLHQHPAVHEACVVGVEDPDKGELVKAFIVLDSRHEEEVTEASIMQWARGHMAAYKIPRRVEFREQLPKSASGKIMWKTLQSSGEAS